MLSIPDIVLKTWKEVYSMRFRKLKKVGEEPVSKIEYDSYVPKVPKNLDDLILARKYIAYPSDSGIMITLWGDFSVDFDMHYTSLNSSSLGFDLNLDTLYVNTLYVEELAVDENDIPRLPMNLYYFADEVAYQEACQILLHHKKLIVELPFANRGLTKPSILMGGRYDDLNEGEEVFLHPSYLAVTLAVFGDKHPNAEEIHIAVFEHVPSLAYDNGKLRHPLVLKEK